MQNSKLKIKNLILTVCIFNYLFLVGCSQPVMESEQCIASRNVVKRFYSFHVGNDMKPSAEYLKKRKEYLSGEIQQQISNRIESEEDYFTQTDDYPKAFRAGACENAGRDKTNFEILLFWRNDETNTQREIEVEMINQNNKWLINKVTSKE